jgi:hypothetical protein
MTRLAFILALGTALLANPQMLVCEASADRQHCRATPMQK